MIGNHAVFITQQALEELNGVAELWLNKSERGHYILCMRVNTDGVFTHLEIEDKNIDGNMHLKIPHHYIRAILFAESLDQIGFIQNDEE